jgi:hypothetical protein
MKSKFKFGFFTRRILRKLVSTMKPRWDDLDLPVEDLIIARMERDVGRFPRLNRTAVVLAIWAIQWSGPLVWRLPIPFTWLSERGRVRRLKRLKKGAAIRHGMVQVVQTFVNLIFYSLPEVEAKLGVDRVGWVKNRVAFREHLMAEDLKRASLPPTPEPLNSLSVDETNYLAWNAPDLGGSSTKKAGAHEPIEAEAAERA